MTCDGAEDAKSGADVDEDAALEEGEEEEVLVLDSAKEKHELSFVRSK